MKAAWMILLTPGVLLAQATETARPIPLDEAVRLARRNAPAAVQARNTVRQNAATVRTNYAQYLPSVNVSAGAGRQGGETFFQGNLVPYSGNPWSYSRGLNSNLELFDGGRRWYNLRAAQANVDAASAGEVSQSFTIALNVKQQYYAVLAARESEAAARKQLEQAQQQFRAASARVAAGAATRSDSLRSAIQVGNARLAVLTAENSLRTANAALSRLVGSTEILTAVASDTSEIATVTLDEASLLKMAEEGPGVEQASMQYFAAKQGVRASKTPYLPTLSMSFGVTYNATSQKFEATGNRFGNQYNTRFNVSYPLFNNLSREENVVRARVAEDNAEANLRDTKLNQRQQLVQFLGAFRTAEQRAAIQLASVIAGEEDLRVQQERYNLGASTLLDLLTSQTTLDQARAALIQARFDARTAKAQIESLIGRDL